MIQHCRCFGGKYKKNSEHRKFTFIVFPVYVYFSEKDELRVFFLMVSDQLAWSQKRLRYISRTCIHSKARKYMDVCLDFFPIL